MVKHFNFVLFIILITNFFWSVIESYSYGESSHGERINLQVNYKKSMGDTLRLRKLLDAVGYDHDPEDFIAGKLKEIGIKRIRLIGVDNHTKVVEGQLQAPLLENKLDWCRRHNFIPHIIIGQLIPIELSTHQGDPNFGPKDFQAYEKYVHLFFTHVIFQRGFANATWEVANEPDCGGAPVTQYPRPKLRSEAEYLDYLQLYKHIAKVAVKLENEHPGLKIPLGGLASCGPGTYQHANFNWHERFLKDIAHYGLKLDFFSFHYYGNQSQLGKRQNLTKILPFEEMTERLHQWINLYKPHTPIWITEWGFSWLIHKNPEAALLNGSNVGAAWSAAFINAMLKNGIERSILLTSSDKKENWGWPSLFHGTKPKPLYFVFAMFKALEGNFIEVAGETNAVGALAAADNQKVRLLIWNYNWIRGRLDKGREVARNHEVILQIKELPPDQAEYQIKTSLLAEAHGNPLATMATGSQGSEVPLVTDAGRYRQNQGVLNVNFSLPPSSVMLIELMPESR